MSNYSTLKAAISAVIKENNNHEITGQVLQTTLLAMVDSLADGYLFKGVATPATVVGTPDENVFYIGGAGTYSNFGATPVNVPDCCIGIFTYNGSFENHIIPTGGVFDISAYNAVGGTPATYADLTAALGTGGANIPDYLRKGGMSVKFIQGSTPSSDNNYVQARLMLNVFTTDVTKWQVVDDEPTAGSKNLIESGGTFKKINENSTLYPLYTFNITSQIRQEGIPTDNRSALYLNRDKIKNLNDTYIYGVSAYLYSGNTIKVYKSTLNVANFSETLIQEFSNCVVGWNTVVFDEPILLGTNETIGVRSPLGWVETADTGVEIIDNLNSTPVYIKFEENSILLFPLVRAGGAIKDIQKQLDNTTTAIQEQLDVISNTTTAIKQDLRDKTALYPLYAFNPYGHYYPELSILDNRTAITLGNSEVDIFRTVPIDAISVYLSRNSTFTLYKCINVGTQEYSETLIQSFEGKKGWNLFYLSEPLSLSNNETIGTRTPYVGYYVNNDIGAGWRWAIITPRGETNSYYWVTDNNLVMPLIPLTKSGGVLLKMIQDNKESISSIVNTPHKFHGKKLSIMGDSISTYGGVQPSGNAIYYPQGDVNSYSKTWSGLLIEKTGMILDTLQTWSGSMVTGSKDPGSSAFVSSDRWRDGLGNPDIIIVYGGTNDIWGAAVDKGEIPNVYNYTSQVTPSDHVEDTFDVTKFAPAYLYLLMKLKRTYPNAIIYACATTDFNRVPNEYWLNNRGLSKQIARDIIKQCTDIVGCRFIDLAKCGINYYNNATYAVGGDAELGGLHPNFAGMQLIANYIYENL